MPRPMGVIIWDVTENAFRKTCLPSPPPMLPLLHSLASLPAFCLHESPSSLSLCANVWWVSSKDNSVVLHTSSASTVQTGGRGGCCLESFGSALSAVNHSRLLYERGKRSVQRRSPGRMSAIRWKREGEVGKKTGKKRRRGRENWGGGGAGREIKRRDEMDWNASAEIKRRSVKRKRKEREMGVWRRWLWFASNEEPQRVARMFYSTWSFWEVGPVRHGWVCARSQQRERERDWEGGAEKRGLKWTSLHFCH